jgi:hypothetical protein
LGHVFLGESPYDRFAIREPGKGVDLHRLARSADPTGAGMRACAVTMDAVKSVIAILTLTVSKAPARRKCPPLRPVSLALRRNVA